MPDIRVRSAGPEDVPAMASVFVAASREAWQPIFGAASLAALEPPIERLRGRICANEPREQVLVAEVDGEVRGYAIVRPSSDGDSDPERDGELDALYTDPALWGKGIGRALLAAAVRALTECGFVDATLWTGEANARARRVYAAAGWKLEGATRERTWRGVHFRELRYRIELLEA